MGCSLTVYLLLYLISLCCLPVSSLACPDIPISEARHRIANLGEEIHYHNKLYYDEQRSVISDAEYDRQFAELVRLEECFPELVQSDSPSRRVGGSSASGKLAVKHERPMLSLSSSTGSEAVEALLGRLSASGEAFNLLAQPKIDGLPVELTYVNGRLVSASTRGNGSFGEDVTNRVRGIRGIPRLLSSAYPERVVMRGEVYADRHILKSSEGMLETYATPRHLAAGTLLAQNPDDQALAALRFFPFELVTADLVAGGVNSDWQALRLLADWGIPVDFASTRRVKSLAEIQEVYQDYQSRRDDQPFAMDGIVVKVDDLLLRKRMGEGGRAPFWAAAWKFPPDTTTAGVLAIRWNTGRTGRRTPVAEVTPVQLGGVRVNRVSLNSAAELERLDIAAGDRVVIGLVGDVIPQVMEVVSRAPRLKDSVPVKLQETAIDACLQASPGCRDQFLARAVHFTSKSGLNITGLGRKRLQELIDAGIVHDLPSILHLNENSLLASKFFGARTAQKLAESIGAASRPKPFQLVVALGVPGVGKVAAERLAQHFTSLDALLSAGDAEIDSLSAGNARAATAVRKFFRSPGGKDLLDQFRVMGALPK